MEKLKLELNKLEGGKILDVGTGRGEFVNLLKSYLNSYQEIIGIDSHEKAIDYCKEKYQSEKINFKKMDASNMYFPNNAFDMVCISNSLHHLSNIDIILQEMMRVLKPNGIFLINEMFSDNQSNEQMSHVKIHHWSAKIDTLSGVFHDKTYKREKIVNIIKKLSLNDINIFDYKYVSDNPKDNETIEHLNNVIETVIERVQDTSNYDSLKNEANSIKEWINEFGFQSATELMIIGRKV